MERSTTRLQAKLMRDYYRDFSKYARGHAPANKVAWVTAFTPVEILEALDISYVYPESYAAVIAASNREQPMLEESERRALCRDCCSYACCFMGSLALQSGPRGMLPKPDVLIASNNQCNTLSGWWSVLADELHIPFIKLDYPGESTPREQARAYVDAQHAQFIEQMEALSGNKLDPNRLDGLLEISASSVRAWERVTDLLAVKDFPPTILFDSLSYLINSRCKPETAQLFEAMAQELRESPDLKMPPPRIFWLGYPLWYHEKRYLAELLRDCRIVGSNYVTWWCLDYAGESALEKLFSAYNFTFTNLKPETKRNKLSQCIARSGAEGAITLHNKSCKVDFVSARHIDIPQVELEVDMIDRNFLDVSRAKRQIDALLENL